jgi:hypothetical protein
VDTVFGHRGPTGVAGKALQLCLLWALRYNWNSVAVYNVPAPGITPAMDRLEEYRVVMAYLREKVRADDFYQLVDADRMVIEHKWGTYSLGEA